MSDLPNPPIAPDVDLRNFRFMPLDVVRLRDSDLALTASAEGFRAAVLLWCAAWHQIPAGSLPNDDRALARLAGCDVDTMHRIRDEALRGFTLHNDGRLYHRVVVEKAVAAWAEKQRYQKAARKRWGEKRKRKNATHVKRSENASCESDKSDMQRTGNRQGDRERLSVSASPHPPAGGSKGASKPAKKAKPIERRDYPPAFEAFWLAYPRNPADTKASACAAWEKARSGGVSEETLLAGARAYRGDCEARGHDRPMHVQTWVNKEGWTATYRTSIKPKNGLMAAFDEIDAKLRGGVA